MGRKSNRALRRQQITAALMTLMATEGYERASIKSIALAAGLTPGLVHYHFPNKQAILLELVETIANAVSERYHSRVATLSDPLQRLFAFIDAHLALGSDAWPEAVRAWVAIGAEALRQPEVNAVYAAALDARFQILRELVSQALPVEVPADHHASIAAGLLSAIEGAFQLATAAPGLLPSGFAAPTVKRMAESLIAGAQHQEAS